MTIFQQVKLALDALQPARGRGAWASRVHEQFPVLMDRYRNLANAGAQPLDYSDPATQAAYMFKYVGPHACFLAEVLQRARANRTAPIFGRSPLRVTCVGGGPGSDVLGVLDYFERLRDERVSAVEFELLDREPAWSAVWDKLQPTLSGRVQAAVTCSVLDITDAAAVRRSNGFGRADLITMSFFVSEILRLGTQTDRFWTEMIARARSGTVFVVADFWSRNLNAFVDARFPAAGFRTILTGDDSAMGVPENSAHLEPYRTLFDHHPRGTGNVAYRVLRKP